LAFARISIGSTGTVRPAPWIWYFSSTHNLTAFSGSSTIACAMPMCRPAHAGWGSLSAEISIGVSHSCNDLDLDVVGAFRCLKCFRVISSVKVAVIMLTTSLCKSTIRSVDSAYVWPSA